MIRIPALAILCAWPAYGWAFDIFAFRTQEACPRVGGIIDVDEDSITLLGLDGKQTELPSREVVSFQQYNSLQNPFPALGKGPVALLRIRLKGEEEAFVGFATGFFDELILFIDTLGNTRVVAVADIEHAEQLDPSETGGEERAAAWQRVSLSPTFKGRSKDSGGTPKEEGTGSVLPCPGFAKAGEQGLVPVRSFEDRLAIQSFLRNMRNGYVLLAKLVERADFYPRANVLSERSRMGLRITRALKERNADVTNSVLAEALPIYFETGGGTAYGYQGTFLGGAAAPENIPGLDTEFVFHSRFKAHALHGALTGNLGSLPAGTEVFSRELPSRAEDLPTSAWVRQSFNHVTSFGADFRGWSASIGSFYPVVALGDADDMREVRSSSASFLGRVGYMAPTWDVEAYGYHSEQSRTLDKAGPGEDSSIQETTWLHSVSDGVRVQAYRFRLAQARVNGTWQLRPDVRLGASLLGGQVRYSEDAVDRRRPKSNTRTWSLRALTYAGRAYGRFDFGQWIALKGEVLAGSTTLKGGLGSGEDKETNDTLANLVFGLEVLL